MSGAKHVGIVGIEIYFPSVYIDQRDLEKHDEVSEGKYTIGLGQQKMGICSDREDINSLAISAFDKLVRRFVILHQFLRVESSETPCLTVGKTLATG